MKPQLTLLKSKSYNFVRQDWKLGRKYCQRGEDFVDFDLYIILVKGVKNYITHNVWTSAEMGIYGNKRHCNE